MKSLRQIAITIAFEPKCFKKAAEVHIKSLLDAVRANGHDREALHELRRDLSEGLAEIDQRLYYLSQKRGN